MDVGSVEQATFYLPVGAATFLLADVESGRLRESPPDAIAAVVAHHYELLNEVISRHGGVRRQQDEQTSVVAAFSRASDAVAAALDVQRAVHAESQPEGTSLKQCIGLHTAEAQRHAGGAYFGQAINRCARLRAIAHGGQIVLSRTTRDLVLDRLPEHAKLTDLGVHRRPRPTRARFRADASRSIQ